MDERVHGSAAGIQLPAGRTPWMMCPMKQVLPSVNLSAWIKRTSFLVEHENDPRVENPQPSQRKRQKIMGEDPQSLENHGFPQISQLVLHSMLCNQKRYCTGKPRNHNGFWAFSYPDFQVQTKRYFSLLRGLELPTPTISGGFQEDFSSESRLFFVFAENFF